LNLLGLLASRWHFCYFGGNTTAEAEMLERPDYAALAQEVKALGAQTLSSFHGEAREEVDYIFKGFRAALELTDTVRRRVPDKELTCVRSCIGAAQEAIPDLKHYEVNNAVVKRFEEMQSELNAWAGELRARGQVASGPACPPI
jgi:hypothetical protein